MKNLFKSKIIELSNFNDIEFKPFYENAYWVSNRGHIIRYGKFQSGYTIKEPRLLKCGVSKGYYIFSIREQSKNKTFRVHQVVANAFLGKMPKSKECINHKDGNKRNNHVLNLEYVTYAENRRHAIENTLAVSNPNQKLTKQQEEDIKKNFIHPVRSNIKELSAMYNVSESTIKRIVGVYDF